MNKPKKPAKQKVTVAPEHEFKGLNLYTDGACGPSNPGFIGYSTHGYLYSSAAPKRGSGLQKYHITNIGYIIEGDVLCPDYEVTPIEYYDVVGSRTAFGTNNVGELEGLHSALKIIQKHPEATVVNVYIDSEYARKVLVEWGEKWERNNWCLANGEPVKNVETVKTIYYLYQQLRLRDVEINFHWVKGHGTNLGNIIADTLAVIGKRRSGDLIELYQEDVRPAQGYWGERGDVHPMIDKPYMLLLTECDNRIPGCYYFNTSGDLDQFPGTKRKRASYSIVLGKPDYILEEYIGLQNQISYIPTLVLADMSKMLSAQISRFIKRYGRHVLKREDKGKNINVGFPDGSRVSEEVKPMGIANREMECISFLKEKIFWFKHLVETGVLIGNSKLEMFHDVTSVFFTSETKKNGDVKAVLNPKLNSTVKLLPINVEVTTTVREKCEARVDLIFGHDILERNHLKKLEELDPKVYIHTWFESPHAMRYCVFITTNDGNIGVWCAMHTNIVLNPNFTIPENV